MKKKVEKMVGKTSKLAENQESASGVGTDQGAPGALKTEIREENLDAATDLGAQAVADTPQAPEPEKNFATQRESIEDLDPGEIQPFQTIPDYLEPTSSLYPIVVKNPTSTICIEGWSKVCQAKEAKQVALTCHIHHVTEISEEELAIRKVAIRVSPQGGIDSYAERVRNVEKLSRLLTESTENLTIFYHGGPRRGSAYTNNREEDIRLILAQRLGKSRATIGKCLNHASHINNDVMQVLVEGKVDKDFFEEVQKVKRKLVDNLTADRKSEEEITRRVSETILRMHQDPLEIENLWDSLIQATSQQNTNAAENVETRPEPSNGQEEELEDDDRSQTPDHLDPWTGNQETLDDQSIDDQEIRRRGVEIAERVKEHLENQSLTLHEMAQAIRREIQEMLLLLARVSSPEALPIEMMRQFNGSLN
jgi:hypothetical protein